MPSNQSNKGNLRQNAFYANFGPTIDLFEFFLALLMRLLRIPEAWEVLHYGKCAIECFFPRNSAGKMVT